MAPEQTALLQGTLDLLILKSLALDQMHGLGIARRVEQITRGTFQVKPGSLFPALHRMEEEGWVTSEWGESENNRRAKYYRLTKTGRKQLETESERWSRISLAIAQALASS
ncbi:MAG: PadR family transcriptional regulator [Acidobacteria bacterium]|nr:MAG: PadR family transcriptional regulator [Acidobacteriota bacterium]PYY24144.1 MAG: PadR family transcriptional regulator [Acidobacteriota bacterium]